MKEQSTEEARYKRLDERIRSFQKSRREVAAAAEYQEKETEKTALTGPVFEKRAKRKGAASKWTPLFRFLVY